MTPTLEFRDSALYLLDQTRLPLVTALIECRNHRQVCDAIQRLAVRGAPAIGLAAAYGVVLAAQQASSPSKDRHAFDERVRQAIADLVATRPTAVNLSWALNQMSKVLTESSRTEEDEEMTVARLRAVADGLSREDEEANRQMGRYGADLIADGANVLTHCNAGALATGAFGTALGVVFAANEQGKRIHVWVGETRPLLQGSRLTAWELEQAGIPYTIITDGMAGHFMARGEIDAVLVGSDRIAANGDAANKIGTYGLAILANAHDIPIYFVAPTSTVDLSTANGDLIPIEERRPEEVSAFRSEHVAPARAHVANPAFDVTPARLITAIITESGVVRPPFSEALRAAVEQSPATRSGAGVADAGSHSERVPT